MLSILAAAIPKMIVRGIKASKMSKEKAKPLESALNLLRCIPPDHYYHIISKLLYLTTFIYLCVILFNS